MIRISLFSFLALMAIPTFGQVLDVSPAFPTVDDNVTIVYNAQEGNAALTGATPVYAHAGLITDQSTSPTNWLFVQGNWGTADNNVLMTDLGNDLHSITIDIDQFYGYPGTTTVEQLAFVFRNTDGSIVGRSGDGSDIYYPIYPANAGFLARFFAPESAVLTDLGSQINIVAKSNEPATLSLYDNGVLETSVTSTDLLDYNLTVTSPGEHELVLEADNGTTTVYDTVHYIVNPAINVIDPPTGTVSGLNHIDANTVRIQLYAPDKNNVYVIGDFNNWTPQLAYHMNRGTDDATWWIDITGLTPGTKYGYQYFIDGDIKVADPMSELIADPNNDNSISAETYPNPYTYPSGEASGFVTLFETDPAPFGWQHDAVPMPDKEDLIIYEVLVRDFVSSRNYLTIIDTLWYLDSLGINAIELMPVGEFENNDSWGYNPSFHMALDKYYGTPEHFKLFVDACHERGIAVILDIALNHTFGQSPMLAMYWDPVNQQPATNNPWFNSVCPHPPFCWGYDINHEVQATHDYIDRVNQHWLSEYHLDGFRFDYTKGFVNNSNGFSQTRIDLLKRMADEIWALDPNAYVILEHWADNNEEIQLSDYGMMLWGNVTHDYAEAVKGYSSNLNSAMYTERGWNDPHLVTYIESHDEERLMYGALTFGNTSNPNHNPQDINIALKRSEAAAVTMLTMPGPKMIWQFGEMGYDISIDYICRVCPKPVLWNYYDEAKRQNLFRVYSSVLYLRNNYPTFTSQNFSYALTSPIKKMVLQDPTMDAVVFTHFGLVTTAAIGGFPSSGTWYEYFTGDTLDVTNVNMTLNLDPGEYRIYTTEPLPKPDFLNTVAITELSSIAENIVLYPNPVVESVSIEGLTEGQPYHYMIVDATGRVVGSDLINGTPSTDSTIQVGYLSNGTYRLFIESEGAVFESQFVKN
ncbi:MAG: alpha-amylase family glycosyl hydrolase [Crocinitomicaceae bacterium]